MGNGVFFTKIYDFICIIAKKSVILQANYIVWNIRT